MSVLSLTTLFPMWGSPQLPYGSGSPGVCGSVAGWLQEWILLRTGHFRIGVSMPYWSVCAGRTLFPAGSGT